MHRLQRPGAGSPLQWLHSSGALPPMASSHAGATGVHHGGLQPVPRQQLHQPAHGREDALATTWSSSSSPPLKALNGKCWWPFKSSPCRPLPSALIERHPRWCAGEAGAGEHLQRPLEPATSRWAGAAPAAAAATASKAWAGAMPSPCWKALGCHCWMTPPMAVLAAA